MDQRSSPDMLFWEMFLGLQISLGQLRYFYDCLVKFTGDQVEVRGYTNLRMTFSDEDVARTFTIKYIVVNTPSAYNFLLGRPSRNRLGAVPSTFHMKLKLHSLEGKVITMRVDQKWCASAMKTV